MKNTIFKLILTTAFCLLIGWVVDFKFMSLRDLRLMGILIIGTLILLLIKFDKQQLSKQFRFYLILTAVIMSLFMMYGLLYDGQTSMDGIFIESIKPLLFALLVYIPGSILIEWFIAKTRSATSHWQKFLSHREIEVYELIIQDLTNKAISSELYIAESTVKKHVQNILKKANMADRKALIEDHKNSTTI